MSKGQLRRVELLTDTGSRAQLRRVELVTTPLAAHAQIRRVELVTVVAAHAQLRRVELVTDIALGANAGVTQSVQSLERVHLDGLASAGDPTGYLWVQTAGPPVTLEPSAANAQPSFIAPATDDGTTVSFVLTVTDGVAYSPESAPVHIPVAPHVDWVYLAGVWIPCITEVA